MKTLLQLVERQSGHLGKLIQDLIDVATLEQGEIEFVFEWVEVHDVVNSAVERIRAKVPQPIDIKVVGDVESVRCDPVLIGRVMHNLLDNASKFSSSADPISVVVSSEGGYMLIDVLDSGIGIDESEQENIFDRFYQVDSSLTRSAQGAGIGLNIARELTRLHRGDIEVTSKMGEGARFRVSLPIDPDSQQGAPEDPQPKARARQSA
jgi:signal transduction histidine kinase